MRLARAAERMYVREHLRTVRHITINPKAPGVVRVHMIPPKTTWDRTVPYLLILNGQEIMPIGLSWAIMLDCFIRHFEPKDGVPLADGEYDEIIKAAVLDTAAIYPAMLESDILKEMKRLLEALTCVALGKPLQGRLRTVTFAEYEKEMTAPHRMDIMVSAMEKDGHWNCNQKCLHCYAAGQCGASVPELSTAEWKKVIEILKAANIPQLTFTGGEPTLREDLPELVAAADFFVTRLNTNGRRLTPELCKKLYDASLDSVQITLYSSDKVIHEKLVGAAGFDDTVAGIRNALSAGLNCSVNTPLCTLNRDYTETLRFLCDLGIRYVTVSGLIPSGNALTEESAATALSEAEMESILTSAFAFCRENEMEISFTSPGWLSPEKLRKIGFREVPSCGACLSNMAIRPDGEVIPCQSWLTTDTLGNVLKVPFRKIFESVRCREIRKKSAATEYRCQLREENGKGEK